jgi:hypothetical protein
MNLNELSKKHEQLIKGSAAGGGGSATSLDNYLKVEPGKNIIRILPWKDDSKQFFAEAVIHRYEGDDGKIQNYYCRKTQNESCPVCDFYFELWKMHKELGLPPKTKSKYGDLATKIKGTPRYYMNVIDRKFQEANPDKIENAVKILSTGQKVFKKVMDGIFNSDYMDESDPDNTNVLSLKKGNDFVLELGKSGEFNNYDQSTFRIKKSAAGSDREIRVWMEAMHDIHAQMKIGDYDDGKAIVDSLRLQVGDVRGPQRPTDDDDDLGEQKFNKEIRV